jgi:hypothetical protein
MRSEREKLAAEIEPRGGGDSGAETCTTASHDAHSKAGITAA